MLQLVADPPEDLLDERSDFRGAETFSADADHRGRARAAERKQAVEVRVQGDDPSTLASGMLDDLRIGGLVETNVRGVIGVYALFLEVASRAAR